MTEPQDDEQPAPPNTLAERVSRLEGTYEHMASQSLLTETESRIYANIGRWILLGLSVAGVVAAAAAQVVYALRGGA